jgi:hypothetical protein
MKIRPFDKKEKEINKALAEIEQEIRELCNTVIRLKVVRFNLDRIRKDEREVYEKIKKGIAKKFQRKQKKESYLN